MIDSRLALPELAAGLLHAPTAVATPGCAAITDHAVCSGGKSPGDIITSTRLNFYYFRSIRWTRMVGGLPPACLCCLGLKCWTVREEDLYH